MPFLRIKRQKWESKRIDKSPNFVLVIQTGVSIGGFHEELAAGEDRQGDQDVRHFLVVLRVRVKAHGSVSREKHRGVMVLSAQCVQHGIQQTADHGVASRLRAQANQGTL